MMQVNILVNSCSKDEELEQFYFQISPLRLRASLIKFVCIPQRSAYASLRKHHWSECREQSLAQQRQPLKLRGSGAHIAAKPTGQPGQECLHPPVYPGQDCLHPCVPGAGPPTTPPPPCTRGRTAYTPCVPRARLTPPQCLPGARLPTPPRGYFRNFMGRIKCCTKNYE